MPAAVRAHELARCERQVAALERELEHRAETVTAHVKEIHRLRADLETTQAELADAVAVGSELATALRFAVPNSPALLLAHLGPRR